MQDANGLLHVLQPGGRQIASVADFQDTAASVFVTMFEALYNTSLPTVVRSPSTYNDYVHNAGVVLAELQRLAAGSTPQLAVPAVSADDIAAGDVLALQQLVHYFIAAREATLWTGTSLQFGSLSDGGIHSRATSAASFLNDFHGSGVQSFSIDLHDKWERGRQRAAVKIQAQVRRKHAASRVEAIRKQKQGQHGSGGAQLPSAQRATTPAV